MQLPLGPRTSHRSEHGPKPARRGSRSRSKASRSLLIETLEHRRVLDSTVVFNEIMYNPPGTVDDSLEWIELYNQLAVNMDVSEWELEGGVDFTFADQTVVPGRGLMLVVPFDPDSQPAKLAAFLAEYDVPPSVEIVGPYLGQLDNDGEELRLVDNSNRLMNVLDYGDGGDWPVAPDGSGATLARRDPNTASEPAQNWTFSLEVGGTPGVANFATSFSPIKSEVVLPVNARWKHEASGTDLGTAWQRPDFDDSGWDSQPQPSLLVTEVVTGTPRTVEIQNASEDPVNTSGWLVAVNDAWDLQDPNVINTPFETLWHLPASIAPGEILYRHNDPDGDAAHYWGGEFHWFTQGPGWVLVMDDAGNAVDFVIWGYPSEATQNFNVEINGHAFTLDDVWTGPPLPAAGTNDNSLQRSGSLDRDNAADWRFSDPDAGEQPTVGELNVGLTVPFLTQAGEMPPGPTTYYYRTEFQYDELADLTELSLDLLVDDGAVFYLNGDEIYRHNMPAGAITYDTLASSDLVNPTFEYDVPVSAAGLVQGRNVLAVELHQSSTNDPNNLFATKLNATVWPPAWLSVDKDLAFNEIAPATQSSFFLELVNYGNTFIGVGGYAIVSSTGEEYVLPSQTLAPGEFLPVTEAQLGFHPADEDKLTLLTPNRAMVIDGARVKNSLRGRSPDGTGSWLWPTSGTPGEANVFDFHDEIVINEIMYHAPPQLATNAQPFMESPEEWIELVNRAAAAVDLGGWKLDDAVEFAFAPGTVIAPGGYLVVAWDVAAFAAKYPDVAVVGNFDRALGNADDRVLLVDAIGNRADEVHYYDAGRWPGYADGGGSTLELRDPDADNGAAEAWAASDETGRSTWQTYTYRGIATADGIGRDIWHEFVMGLLDSGELLLDDISVVEDPDGAAIQLIQNGSFQADAVGTAPQKWRLIGNHGGHQRSVVVQDPVNPANRVLKLVATGATEHEHNHAETTLSNGRRVTAGKEYEISYRAKWIAGSSQLNTRLYFNWLQATTPLDVPAHAGTPGEQNSQFEPNVGPTYRDFRHAPVVPAVGEATSVTVGAEDPDGVAALTLYYSVNGGGFADRPMSAQADGTYRGTIPGQARGAIVQFYVLASDTLGATSTYPAAGPDSRALYTVADGRERLGQRHNIRVLMTPADRNRLYVDTNRLSNHRMGGTLIYDDQIVHYDVGVRLKGSPWGRTHDNSVSLNVKFGADDRFLGVHDAVAISRRPKKEIVAKHLFNVAGGGLDSSYDDVIYAVTPRPQDDGVALLSMARHTDVYLDSQYANGNDGMLYNLELLYTPTTTVNGNPESLKRNYPYTHTNGQVDVQDLGNDKESYRWNFQIRNGRVRDDYSLMIALAQALELSGAELDAATRELIDVDQWMRTLAMASLAGNDDFYTRIWNHNFQMFQRPEDNKMVALPWDLDRAFQLGTTSPLWGGGRIRKVITLPANERLFYGHVWDIIQNTYNTAYMNPWTSHYGSLTGENYNGILGYIGSRANYALGQLPAPVPFNITTNNGNSFVSSDIGVTLQGKGWIDVREIRLAGSNDPLVVTWTGKDTWKLDVPLASGQNVITLEAFDFEEQSIATDTITVTSSVPDRPLWESLRITEVNYEPVEPTTAEETLGFDDEEFFEFIELKNISTTETLDLTGVEITEGIDYAFAAGTTLAPGQYVVVAANTDAFELRYGDTVNVVGPFDGGKLSNGGEEIELSGRFGEVLVHFTYDKGGAWPGRPGGKGATLELIDPAAVPLHEYERAEFLGDPANWHSSVAYGGTPGAEPQPHQGIVINEVLSHTDVPAYDTIELHNVSDAPIDVAGWYLSDAWGWNPNFIDNYKKFRIPTNDPVATTIAPGGYLWFNESHFNPTPLDPAANHFALDGARGEDVWLMRADAAGNLTHFGDHVEFDAQANGESWGRWPNGGLPDGEGDMYPMTAPTLGSENTPPRIGPVIVSEVQYYPGIFHENFNTGAANRLTEVSGNWVVGGGRYAATPASPGADAIALFDLTDPLWPDYAVEADVNVTTAGGYDANAVVIFDYQGPTDFKFAGAFADSAFADGGQWQIGHRTAGGWVVDAMQNATIEVNTNYDLKLRVEGTTATLLVDGNVTVSRNFNQPLNDGTLGIGTAGGAGSFGMVGVEPAAESDLEFVELYNPTTEPINLSQLLPNPHDGGRQYQADWHLDGGGDMAFDPDTTIGAGGTLVVLSFDPNNPVNAARTDAFRAFYDIDASVPLTGGYGGNLGNGGEQIRLQRPDSPPADAQDYVPRLLEDVVTYDDATPWPSTADGNGHSLHRTDPSSWGDDAASWLAEPPSPGRVTFGAQVINRQVFYNGSHFDDPSEGGNDNAAIAPDKVPLMPGAAATYANYTNYARGITGIMVDMIGVPEGVMPTVADFEFHVGNDNKPDEWAEATPPSTIALEQGAGISGSDRVTLIWNAGEIRNTWLQVTVLPAGLGLNTGDVFYFGNAVAEAGDSDNARVSVADLLLARNNPRDQVNPAAIDCAYDYDRDGQVNATDVLLARNNQTSFLDALDLIDLSAGAGEAQGPAIAELAWLTDLDRPATQRTVQKDAAADAVDRLLATYWPE